MNKQETLLNELKIARQQIKTDSYSMSIGEIINLYRDKDLILNPAFQRLFRWNDDQKTKFIESILIGIPIPQIFVAQQSSGQWTIVDGVQRVSTLLQLTGNLKDKEPLKLTECEYLPSIVDSKWDDLPQDLQRIFRRSKLDINIILTENSLQSQYELFKRLNSGGIHLEDQEMRNCLIIMLDESFYDKVNDLKEYENFQKCLCLSQDKLDKEYHMELILRFFIAKHGKTNYDKYQMSTSLLKDFIDDETAKIISDEDFKINKEIETFKKTFDLLKNTLEKDSFKKYNSEKDKFQGQFSIASFELIASGVANNLDKLEQIGKDNFINKVKELYQTSEAQNLLKRGMKALPRFKGLAELSTDYFSR
ncbi:MAG: DUF262 domain-containing protein [Crocosphaera sp.]|nr:DUF262 domain-containing protein [Crocosphaera sp.]